MNNFDMLTCGSATVDIFAHTQNTTKVLHTPNGDIPHLVYEVGTKMIITSMEKTVGGGGTNTACAIARAGLHTGYVGALGNDSDGALVQSVLRDDGVSFLGHCVTDGTGYSFILDSKQHDRTIFTHKGANDSLRFSLLHLKNVKTKALYCSSMMNDSLAAQQKLIVWAKQQRALVCYNPSAYQCKLGLGLFRNILKYTDVLVCNKEEAQELFSSHLVGRQLLKIVGDYVGTVLITDGPNATYVLHQHKMYCVKPAKIKVVEATGAGDAFASTFFAMVTKGMPVADALTYGLANAQSVISYVGAKQGLLTKKQMQNYIKTRKLHRCVHSYGHNV